MSLFYPGSSKIWKSFFFFLPHSSGIEPMPQQRQYQILNLLVSSSQPHSQEPLPLFPLSITFILFPIYSLPEEINYHLMKSIPKSMSLPLLSFKYIISKCQSFYPDTIQKSQTQPTERNNYPQVKPNYKSELTFNSYSYFQHKAHRSISFIS